MLWDVERVLISESRQFKRACMTYRGSEEHHYNVGSGGTIVYAFSTTEHWKRAILCTLRSWSFPEDPWQQLRRLITASVLGFLHKVVALSIDNIFTPYWIPHLLQPPRHRRTTCFPHGRNSRCADWDEPPAAASPCRTCLAAVADREDRSVEAAAASAVFWRAAYSGVRIPLSGRQLAEVADPSRCTLPQYRTWFQKRTL